MRLTTSTTTATAVSALRHHSLLHSSRSTSISARSVSSRLEPVLALKATVCINGEKTQFSQQLIPPSIKFHQPAWLPLGSLAFPQHLSVQCSSSYSSLAHSNQSHFFGNHLSLLQTISSHPKSITAIRNMATDSERTQYVLNLDNINQNAIKMEYAVRGPIVIRAGEIEKELSQSSSKRPFKQVIRANIGDCHATGQRPLTFLRQVMACAAENSLIDDNRYPVDVRERAKSLLAACGGNSVGAYSESAGVELIRRHAAEYIEKRDGFPANYQDVVLTAGASEGVRAVLALVNEQRKNEKPIGVMVSVPQYPLYSATISEYGMHQINYYLDEEKEWSLDISDLKRALEEAKPHCKPRVLAVINPGNPTGSVLTHENIRKIIEFAYQEKLLIIADEVYQQNIYAKEAEFHSFKKVLREMNLELEIASVMSLSKGFMGECGLRAGYCELVDVDPSVRAIFLKMLSARLCCSVLGQIGLDCVVNPPKPGEASYELFCAERDAVLKDLKQKARLAADSLNAIEGVQSNSVAGAMYAFPSITIPPKAEQAAKEAGQKPDFFYALRLLEQTGVCIVPGSGFGQRPGSHHFRITILPSNELMQDMLSKLAEFNKKFLQEFS